MLSALDGKRRKLRSDGSSVLRVAVEDECGRDVLFGALNNVRPFGKIVLAGSRYFQTRKFLRTMRRLFSEVIE